MGFSVGAGAYRYSLLEQAQAVTSVIDALELQDCTFALTCVGGYLAPLIAAQRPELVRRVILVQVSSWEEERHSLAAPEQGSQRGRSHGLQEKLCPTSCSEVVPSCSARVGSSA